MFPGSTASPFSVRPRGTGLVPRLLHGGQSQADGGGGPTRPVTGGGTVAWVSPPQALLPQVGRGGWPAAWGLGGGGAGQHVCWRLAQHRARLKLCADCLLVLFVHGPRGLWAQRRGGNPAATCHACRRWLLPRPPSLADPMPHRTWASEPLQGCLWGLALSLPSAPLRCWPRFCSSWGAAPPETCAPHPGMQGLF